MRNRGKTSTAWLLPLRLLVLLIGLPVLVTWAAREEALQWGSSWPLAMVAGACLSGLAMMVYALRFRLVMRAVDIELGLVETLRINTLSLFYYFFVPLSLGADLTKFVKLRRHDLPALHRAGGIVLDHFVGLASLLLLSLTLFWWHRPVEIDVTTTGVAIVLVATMILAGFVALRWHGKKPLRPMSLLRRVIRERTRLGSALVLSCVMQVLLALAVFVGSSAWDLQVAYLDILFVLTTALIFQAVPLNIGGVGVAEAAGTGLYLALGLPLQAAVLLVSLLVIYRLMIAIVGGLWDLLPQPTAAHATSRPYSD